MSKMKDTKNKSIFLMPGGEFVEKETAIEHRLSEDYILLDPIAIGCCGSDVGYTKEAFSSSAWPQEGLTLGHELIARAEDGKLYVVNPQNPCGVCEFCLSGRTNMCSNVKFLGVVGRPGRPQVEGALKGKFYWPQPLMFPLPEGLGSKIATMIEPMACAVHSLVVAHPQPGEEILVIGSGQMGILISMLLDQSGHSVYLIGRNKSRNKIARNILGTDIEVGEKYPDAPPQFEIVIDCAGSTDSLQQAINRVKPGGRILMVGNYNEKIISVDMYNLTRKSALLVSSRRFTAKDFKHAVSLTSKMCQKVELLLSESYPITLEGVSDAFQRCKEDRSIIKVVMVKEDV